MSLEWAAMAIIGLSMFPLVILGLILLIRPEQREWRP